MGRSQLNSGKLKQGVYQAADEEGEGEDEGSHPPGDLHAVLFTDHQEVGDAGHEKGDR